MNIVETQTTIRLYGARFRVSQSSIPWLAKYLVLDTAGPLTSDWEVVERVSALPSLPLDMQELQRVEHFRGKYFQALQSHSDASFRVFLSEDRNEPDVVQKGRSVEVYLKQDQYPGRYTLRLIREIVYRELLRLRYVAFHAASVSLRERGLLIVGPSGAGKTSLAIALSSLSACTFVGNDRSLVNPTDGSMFALPLPIRIARESLPSVEPLAGSKIYERARDIVGVSRDGDSKVEIAPTDLAALLGCHVAHTANLRLIVVPTIKAGAQAPAIKPLPDNQALPFLVGEACFPRDPLWPDDWLVRTNDAADTTLYTEVLSVAPAVSLSFGLDWYDQRCAIERLLSEHLE